jgi:hypothetical protein
MTIDNFSTFKTHPENKELLLKDLCARLPYGVYYKHFTWDDECGEGCIAAQIYSINTDGYVKNCYDDETVYIDDVRPYLFPISSMTDEQKDEYHNTCNVGLNRCGEEIYYDSDESIDWLNAHHFDYRGLIEKGLAIDATGLNIY